jgi:transcriptional regulator, XRE family protein
MTTIEIVSDANGSHRLVGQAHVTRSRGQVSTTILYDPTHLAGCEHRSRTRIDYPQGH